MGLPHSILDNQHFRNLLQTYESIKLPQNQKIPSAYQHRKKVNEIGNKIFQKTLSILAPSPSSHFNSPSFVTLAIDGWTGHTYGSKNTNTIALCKEKSYLLWSDRNDNDNDAVECYLFPLISKQISELLQRGVMIVAITTDNAANMILLGTELYQIKPQGKVILHISCSAHTIQLMIAKIVELSPVKRIIEETEKLLEAFTTMEGKKYRLEMRNHQLVLFPKRNPLKLLFYNATRWLSRLVSLERLIKLKDSLKFVATNGGLQQRPKLSVVLNSQWWEKLEKGILPLIKQFALATNIVQSDGANLRDLQDSLNGFRNAILNNDFGNVLGVAESTENNFVRNAIKIIDDYVDRYIASTDHHAYRAVGIISDSYDALPPNANRAASLKHFTAKDAAEKWIADWGSDLIMFYQSKFPQIHTKDKPHVMSNIKRQLVMFKGGLDNFVDKEKDIQDLVRVVRINSFKYDKDNPEKKETCWKLFWIKQYDRTPELATVALCLLSIGISEATVERSFSVQKLSHNDIRNRLAADIVQSEMRIRFNKSIANTMFNSFDDINFDDEFQPTDDPQTNEDVEMSDEDIEENNDNHDEGKEQAEEIYSNLEIY